jgi:hypothetical protein
MILEFPHPWGQGLILHLAFFSTLLLLSFVVPSLMLLLFALFQLLLFLVVVKYQLLPLFSSFVLQLLL